MVVNVSLASSELADADVEWLTKETEGKKLSKPSSSLEGISEVTTEVGSDFASSSVTRVGARVFRTLGLLLVRCCTLFVASERVSPPR